MATIIMKLDTRSVNARGQHPVKFQISHNSAVTTIGAKVAVSINFWFGEINKAVTPQCPNAKHINDHLEALYFKYSNRLRDLDKQGRLDAMSVVDIRDALTESNSHNKIITFSSYFAAFIGRKEKESTANIYKLTMAKIEAYAKQEEKKEWLFADINIEWLNGFDRFLKTQHLSDDVQTLPKARKLGVNGIGIHFRNIRAVLNSAIDEELTTIYPFRKFKIKHEETQKRSLTIEELQTLMTWPCEDHQVKYRDIFMLIIYLVGINTIDLFMLTEVKNGRIEYRRSKTGRLFSVKVEPEAQAIIDKYKGDKYLLDVLDVYSNYKDFAHRMNLNLGQIGVCERKGLGGKKIRTPLHKGLTSYWARHTWATLAAELDIPDATISAALGHSSGNKVTNIYINRDRKKVDEANRKVIDYILGDNKTAQE